jgi:D-sedoheptulose 7-phosphate isomerase
VAHAHAKEMSVVALVGLPPDAAAHGLTDTDVLVNVGPERAARVHELHLLIVHSLCDAVDLQLMGEEHAE